MKLFNIFKKNKKSNVLQKVEKSHLFKRYFLLIVGLFIYSIGYNLFLKENNIVSGGASGISILTKDLIDPSIMLLILNIVFLIMSLIFLGKKDTLNTVLGSLLLPVFVKLTANIGNYIKIDNSDLLLVSIIGGVLIGFSLGLVFKAGFTSGGTDTLNKIVSKYAKVSLGTAMILTDGFIVLAGAFVFGWTKALYAIIILYIINIMVDKVVLGISSNKCIYITTEKDDDVINYLINELKLGTTLIETRGGYSNKKDQIVMCVAPTSEYFKIKEGIEQIDPAAVLVITDAYQTHGIYNGNVVE